MKRQHKTLRVPDNWRGQDRSFVMQLEQILDDIYNNLNTVKSVLGIEPNDDGDIALTKESVTGLGIPSDETLESYAQKTDLDEYAKTSAVETMFGKKFPHIRVEIGEKLKITAGSRKSFIVLACGGTNSAHRGAYICYSGANSETYQVETLVSSSTVTVAASASGITFTNATVYKFFDIIDPTDTVAYTIT